MDIYILKFTFYIGREEISPTHRYACGKAKKLIRKHKVIMEKMHEDSKLYGDITCHAELLKDDNVIAVCETCADEWVYHTKIDDEE